MMVLLSLLRNDIAALMKVCYSKMPDITPCEDELAKPTQFDRYVICILSPTTFNKYVC